MLTLYIIFEHKRAIVRLNYTWIYVLIVILGLLVV